MDTPDIFSQSQPPEPLPASAEVVASLEQECQDLRALFHATLIAALFVALAANAFLFMQMRQTGQQVNNLRSEVLRVDSEFQRFRHPEFSRFMGQLQAYASSHRDFQTNILDRYRFALPQYFSAPTPVQPVSPLTPATNPLVPRLPGR